MRVGFYRFLVVILTVSIVALTCFSCARVRRTEGTIRTAATQRLSGAYRCDADIQYNGSRFKAAVTRLGAGNCSVSFEQPASVSGLCFALKGSALKLSFSGLTASPAESAMPESSLIRALSAALDASANPTGLKAGRAGKGSFVSGHIPAGKYTLTLGDGSVPQKLSVPAAGVEATFSGVVFKD